MIVKSQFKQAFPDRQGMSIQEWDILCRKGLAILKLNLKTSIKNYNRGRLRREKERQHWLKKVPAMLAREAAVAAIQAVRRRFAIGLVFMAISDPCSLEHQCKRLYVTSEVQSLSA